MRLFGIKLDIRAVVRRAFGNLKRVRGTNIIKMRERVDRVVFNDVNIRRGVALNLIFGGIFQKRIVEIIAKSVFD